MENRFVPLLLGADINVYSMARAFHEAYGVKTVAYGMFRSGPCMGSDIIDYRVCEKNDEPEVVLANVKKVAEEFPDRKVIVLGCGDNYLTSIACNLPNFPENVIAPYIDLATMEVLIHKEKFYELCDQYGIDHPATFVYKKGMGHDFELPFSGPFVVKPAESATYWDHPFDTQKKAYILQTREEVDKTLDEIYEHGYEDSLIIQDFIPGDDSYMRVVTNYSGEDKKVRLMCVGHVLLEEHTRHGIGNHAVIITESEPELCAKLRHLLESIGYTGFSNFDVKFDQRDGKFKVFEINTRQGRSNYYVTGAGYNLARYLVEDRIEHKPCPLTVTENRHLWMVIPKQVAFDYIPKKYHGDMQALMDQGQWVNPLFYKADKNLIHKLRILRDQQRYKQRYASSMEKANG
ncbi:ATP-grasp domain-containing protein [Pseudoflavonifractor sp. MSJ-37]|uniref:carboxylate--amine ligase n=1 Tax=Pseudoflavonifractor sp. MSJ-37 TaxID=2841531 RepID=UPI001C0FD693|nr:ATP-grasp domain-containing protein [Pseudoflavonifractor sp. MSJ-37]MBU5436040.1 ATP-grasp domain-containing protein [Pseudoflavonifractor sp. MSJ-37]